MLAADAGAARDLPAGRGAGIPIRNLAVSRLDELHAHRRTDLDRLSRRREPSGLLSIRKTTTESDRWLAASR